MEDGPSTTPPSPDHLDSVRELSSIFAEQGGSAMNTTQMLRRSSLTGRFLVTRVEALYLEWHAERIRQRVIAVGVFGALGFLTAALLSMQGQSSYKSMVLSATPENTVAVMASTVGARCIPLLSVSLLLHPRLRSLLFNGRTYQHFIFFAYFMTMLVEIIPLLLITARDTGALLSRLPPPAEAIVSATLLSKSNCSALTRSTDPTYAVRSAYWHAINVDFCLFLAGGLTGMRPIFSLVFGVLVITLWHLHLIGMWRFTEHLRGPLQWTEENDWVPVYALDQLAPIYYRVLPILSMVFIAAIQDRAHRDEFYYRQLLHLAKNARIEQLLREKDRLNWDHRLRGGQPSPRVEVQDGAHDLRFSSTEALAAGEAERGGADEEFAGQDTLQERDLHAIDVNINASDMASEGPSQQEGRSSSYAKRSIIHLVDNSSSGGEPRVQANAPQANAPQLTTTSRLTHPEEGGDDTGGSCSELGEIFRAGSRASGSLGGESRAGSIEGELGRMVAPAATCASCAGTSARCSRGLTRRALAQAPSAPVSSPPSSGWRSPFLAMRESSATLVSRERAVVLWRTLREMELFPKSSAGSETSTSYAGSDVSANA